MTLGDKILGREDPLGTLELEVTGREHDHHRCSVNKLRGFLKGVRFSGEGKGKKKLKYRVIPGLGSPLRGLSLLVNSLESSQVSGLLARKVAQ